VSKLNQLPKIISMDFPKISIITPSYNQGQFLEETILSVLNQGYPNLEYIIIDGGSTDNSVDVIKKYEDRITYWVSEPDNGMTDALNKGFKQSTGDILNWINSDDYFLSAAFYTAAEAFSNNDPMLGFIYGRCQNIRSDGSLLEERNMVNFDAGILRYGRNLFAQPASFFHKRVIDKIGLLNENLSYAMDYEFWIRACEADFRFKNISVPLATYRYHARSKTVGERSKQIKEHEQVMLERVLHLKRNRFSLSYLRTLVWLFRLKNMLLRGIQQKQWSFNSLERARKKGLLE
jgi:glycosyltransferase involved in cell wall biosynthesis